MEKTAVKNYLVDLQNYLKLKVKDYQDLNEVFSKITITDMTSTKEIDLDTSYFQYNLEFYVEVPGEYEVTYDFKEGQEPWSIRISEPLELGRDLGFLKLEFTEITPPTLAERVTALEEKVDGL